MISAPRPAANGLLASLPPDVQQRIYHLGIRVALEKSAILIETGAQHADVYFPCSGLLSLQTMTQDGSSVEVAMVGREGATPPLAAISSTPAAYTTVVTVAGEALRIPADALQAECDAHPALQRALIQQWHALMSEIACGSACHRFHTARQRLARWLLMASDRIHSSRVELTQEQLADVLGLRRPRVTVANLALQDAGAITSRHGRIRILDRACLQTVSCECYPQEVASTDTHAQTLRFSGESITLRSKRPCVP
jgi:CRP-like cAMP-binding protein